MATVAALFVACGSGEDLADAARGSPEAPERGARTATPTADDAVQPAADFWGSDDSGRLTAEVDDVGYEVRASITAGEFCRQAELTITRWDLPEALGDHVQLGNIELRYRLPPGAEPVTIWMGVNLELGRITFGDLFRLDRSLAELFPNADPRAPFPTMIPSHSFDLETDNRTRTISVLITLPDQDSYDRTERWRWSSLSPPPFGVGPPVVLATFSASGTRVRLDGRHCTPIVLPLQ